MIRAAPRSRGFTLVELVVVILVFAVLITALLARLSRYQEMAEKAAMESTLRTIKTGLQIRLAELIITSREAEARVLEMEDPTRWLDTRPPNYGGLYRDPRRPGTWYFDARELHLVYVVNTGNRLEIDREEGGKELRFRVRLTRDPVRLPGGPVERTSGVLLAPVSPYRWP
jgi:prepilin-type N-terminal cleavage/methylation domain-containing protein